MKNIRILLILLSILLASCAGGSDSTGVEDILIVGDGTTEKTYTVANLRALPQSTAAFNEVIYLGVSLPFLLEDAGFDLQSLKAVRATAEDGYSVNYEARFFTSEDVLVAYSHVDNPMTEDDGVFRMVLPGEEGKLNVRMLVEIQVVK